MASLAGQIIRRFGWATLALLLPFAAACSTEPSAESSIERDARVLRELTIPPTARNLDVSSVERINSTARVSWEFETTWSWEQYAKWVTERLEKQGHFAAAARGIDRLNLLKLLAGDTHAVEVDALKPGPPASVRVVFRSWAVVNANCS